MKPHVPCTILYALIYLLSCKIHTVEGAAGERPECTHGKIYITARNSTVVRQYDLNRSLQSMYNERNITLPNTTTNEIYLDVGTSTEVVMAIYRGTVENRYNDGYVNFFSTGFTREDHDDHYHLYYFTPKVLTESAISCSRPIHIASHDNKIAIFCDGNYGTTDAELVNTTIWVYDENQLVIQQSGKLYNTSLPSSHHGVAIPVDDNHVMYSLPHPIRMNRLPNASSYATPWTFQMSDYNGNVLHSIDNVNDKNLYCSGYHGSTYKDNTFVLACDANHGGILIVKYDSIIKTYSSRAVLYPSGFTNHRTGTLTGHIRSPYVIGNFGWNTNQSLIAFAYTDTSLSVKNMLPLPTAPCGFDYEKSDGEYILVFHPNGTLSAYTYEPWILRASVQVVPNMTSCSQAMFVAGYLQAFVVQYTEQKLFAITTDKIGSTGRMVVAPTNLPYTPLSMVVGGAPDLYSCGLLAKDVVVTIAPSALPSMSPLSLTVPTSSPIVVENRPRCGLFGLGLFCPFTFCGMFGRLLGLCSSE